MRARGRHEAQGLRPCAGRLSATRAKRSAGRFRRSRPRFKRGRYRSTRDLRPGRLSRRGRRALQSYKRTCGRFPDTGVAGLPLERQVEAITQLLSGELRAGAVKARRPRADHARGRSGATSLARRRAQLEAFLRDGLGPPLQPGRCREVPDEREPRVPRHVTRAVTHANDARAALDEDDEHGRAPRK